MAARCICPSSPLAASPVVTCRAVGDPHYQTADGTRFNYYGRGLYEHARFSIPACGCLVVVQTLLARLISGHPANTGIAATAIQTGATTFAIADGVVAVSGGGYDAVLPAAETETHYQFGETRLQRLLYGDGKKSPLWAWRVELPGGAGWYVVSPRPVQAMPGGVIYNTWLSTRSDRTGGMAGMCAAAVCPARNVPILPFTACAGVPLPRPDVCYPVFQNASLFAAAELLRLEVQSRLDEGSSVRSCLPPAPPLPSPPLPPPSPPCLPSPALKNANTLCRLELGLELIVTEAGCQQAAATLGLIWKSTVNSNQYIYGCMVFLVDSTESVYFGSDEEKARSSPSGLMQPICLQGCVPPPPPITPAPCKAWQADACADWDNSPSTRCRSATSSSASIACCYDITPTFLSCSFPDADGEFESRCSGGTPPNVPLQDAVDECAKRGGRLCTRAELVDKSYRPGQSVGPCCGSGCGINDRRVWTADSCCPDSPSPDSPPPPPPPPPPTAVCAGAYVSGAWYSSQLERGPPGQSLSDCPDWCAHEAAVLCTVRAALLTGDSVRCGFDAASTRCALFYAADLPALAISNTTTTLSAATRDCELLLDDLTLCEPTAERACNATSLSIAEAREACVELEGSGLFDECVYDWCASGGDDELVENIQDSYVMDANASNATVDAVNSLPSPPAGHECPCVVAPRRLNKRRPQHERSLAQWASEVGSSLLPSDAWHVRLSSTPPAGVSHAGTVDHAGSRAALVYIGVCPNMRQEEEMSQGEDSGGDRSKQEPRRLRKEQSITAPLSSLRPSTQWGGARPTDEAMQRAACAWQTKPVEVTPRLMAWVLASGEAHHLPGVSPAF